MPVAGPAGVSEASEDVVKVDLGEIFGKALSLYHEYSDILIVYKKTKFMQDLYNDIKANVQKVKVILQNELEKIKTLDITFKEIEDDETHKSTSQICPVYQKRLKDITRFLVLIVCTQNQPFGPSNGLDKSPEKKPAALDKAQKEVLKMRI